MLVKGATVHTYRLNQSKWAYPRTYHRVGIVFFPRWANGLTGVIYIENPDTSPKIIPLICIGVTRFLNMMLVVQIFFLTRTHKEWPTSTGNFKFYWPVPKMVKTYKFTLTKPELRPCLFPFWEGRGHGQIWLQETCFADLPKDFLNLRH